MPGRAGNSAVEGYRSARAQRRRGAVLVAGLLVGAGCAGRIALQSGPHAAVGLGLLAVACLGLAWLVRPRSDPERWLHGAAGEAATARLLERLPRRRWAVLHDLPIPGSRANIDHLVIGPTGVWAIDTKTTRGVIRAGWGEVRFGGRRLDSRPTVWEAQVVSDRLGARVRPLIVVHGKGLSPRGARDGGVRVVPAEGLLPRLRRRRWHRLDGNQIEILAGRAETIFAPGRDLLDKGATSCG